MLKPWFISPTYSVTRSTNSSLSSVEWEVSLSNCNLGRHLVGAGTPVLSSVHAHAGGSLGGESLAKPIAVLPSPRLPLVTRQRTLH